MEDMTLWRFWFISRRRSRVDADTVTLLSQRRDDRTLWGRGETVAVCRHDPAHRPPHPGCTCGIYAIGAADIHYASAAQYRARDEYDRAVDAALYGMVGLTPQINVGIRFDDAPFTPSMGDGDVPFFVENGQVLRSQDAADRLNCDVVLGRIRLRNAVAVDNPQGEQLQGWRGAAATIEALYIADEFALDNGGNARDVSRVCDALREKFGVPCTVGYPPYTQAQWDARTNHPPLRDSWKLLGLHAPGDPSKAARRYLAVTVPKRPPTLSERLDALNRRR